MARIEPAISRAQGPLTDELRRRLHDPVLVTSLRVRVAIVLGVAFLMAVKPAFIASLIVVVLAVALGFLVGQVPLRRARHELRNEVG